MMGEVVCGTEAGQPTLCDPLVRKIVIGFGKILDFFLKIDFDVWLIGSTIELTCVQVLGRSRASLWRYSTLFAISPHPQ